MKIRRDNEFCLQEKPSQSTQNIEKPLGGSPSPKTPRPLSALRASAIGPFGPQMVQPFQ